MDMDNKKGEVSDFFPPWAIALAALVVLGIFASKYAPQLTKLIGYVKA